MVKLTSTFLILEGIGVTLWCIEKNLLVFKIVMSLKRIGLVENFFASIPRIFPNYLLDLKGAAS
jgi:hypothetical protein